MSDPTDTLHDVIRKGPHVTVIARMLAPASQPWRPVQYLGSKLRSLDLIAGELGGLDDHPGRVWEPFTGSSVVAQRLAAEGHRVWATDALESSATFAAAMLGVNRAPSSMRLTEAADEVGSPSTDPHSWAPWVDREAEALAARDGHALLASGADVPQRWRTEADGQSMRSLFRDVDDAAAQAEVHHNGLISATYAGTYFGVKQALTLEQLRSRIDVVAPAHDRAFAWVRAGLLTALSHAASAAVFSAGKHFAQPHRVRPGKDLTFHAQRALQDRSVDVAELFRAAANEIEGRAADAEAQHDAGPQLVENVRASDLIERGITAVYADPPYTAQQYSRFYHVLEVLTTGVPARLQRVKGQVTSGLYPDNKYLSPYSSRQQAPAAFRHLLTTARDADAHIILSYSDTRGASTGNARVVTLASLVQWTEEVYGKDAVTVQEMDLRYRQFNSGPRGVTGRRDPEIMVTGRAHAR